MLQCTPRFSRALILVLPVVLLAAAGPTPPEPSGEIIAFWRELREWRPTEGVTTAVSDLTLVRDAMELHLQEGTLTLLDIGGTTTAAVFEGNATMRIDVPLEVERTQLTRLLDWDEPEVDVERLFFLFADSTAAELASVADFEPAELSRSTRNTARDGMEKVVGEDEGQVPEALVRAFLNGEPTELFFAYIFPRRGDDLFFRFDGSDEEEVTVGHEANRGGGLEILSQFRRKGSYDANGVQLEEHPAWMTREAEALHYVVRMDVEELDEISAEADVMLTPNVPGGSWIEASLYYELEVDSVQWGDGSPVVYDRPDDDVSALWIKLPEDAAEGELLTLKVWYHGDVIDQEENFDYLRTTSTWLPRFGASESTFDLTFRTRERWPVMSIGQRVSLEPDPTDDDKVVSRWVTTVPSAQVTFSVGQFEEYEFPGVAGPIRLDVAEEYHRRFQQMTSDLAQASSGSVNVVMQEDPERQVYRDVEASLRFFTQTFGPLDFREYNVAEIPGSHGQAFPAMINLSWQTYVWTNPQGFDEIFRAHEVAHQWWGIAVRPASYHDVWLAEGLAEFSALWYLHKMRADPARYLARLDDLRESVLDRRDHAGPIWLGPRVNVGDDRSEDYQVTVYYKGAWVLHMLRNLLIDRETGSEDLFAGLMKEVFDRFNGSTISTAGFQSLIEDYLGIDMQWFFDEWVYGTDIPKYHFAYTTEDLPDGNVNMKVRVRQEDVPEDFLMPVPILLTFGQQGTAVVSVPVTGAEFETEFVLPEEPSDVTFNASQAVLAEVDRERW